MLPIRFICLLAFCFFISAQAIAQTVSFVPGTLGGDNLTNPTSLQFGPDGKLYVSQQNGLIRVYTVERYGAGNYQITSTETINLIQQIPNHNDNGAVNASITTRQVTGILVVGTAANPVLYVTSSDPRIGGNSNGTDTNLDTNSGMISRLTKNGSSWTKVDLVRGLPRSEENHSPNGMHLDAANNYLYVTQGGNTNMGAPSHNFALLPEFAYSTAILKIDLNAIGNTTYDLPTLDDESRTNVNGAQAGYVDQYDPFGGNDGKNQAMLVAGGPVQIYSTGWRNNYDLVVTEAGRMYSFDNGPNTGWGGPPTNCSNAVSEPGSAICDVLHYVSEGYYAGHANPTRGSRNNTFNTSNPQSPVPAGMVNAAECTYQNPTQRPGAITNICTSMNGICEYRASNFSNAMKGDLLSTGYNGQIYRFKLNATGTALALGGKTTLASGLGSIPLDIVAQGDSDPFPGTVWICTYGSHNISILEPNDFFQCVGDANSPTQDSDGDGYKNADETANGTNHCSAASKPSDFDNDLVSDLNDSDDDNDGISDQTDKFAQDASNGVNTTIPVKYEFDNSQQGGILGWGFTGLMTNGTSDYSTLYDADKMTVGGAALKFTIEEVTEGDPYQGLNDQEYGFQFGVNVSQNQTFVVKTRVMAPFAGIPVSGQRSIGLFMGTGDQDNYLKIVIAANGGTGGIEVVKEVSGTAVSTMHSAPVLNKNYVDLFLYVDRSNNEVQPKYSVNGGSQASLGSPVPVPSSWISNVLAVGFVATAINSGATFPATWDFIEVSVPVADCNGVVGGSAFLDDCGVCSNGNTGHVANSDKDVCGVCFGSGAPCPEICVANEVVSFTLMHAGGSGEIGPLTNGMILNKAVVGSFSIRANKCDNNTSGSVKFIVNGSTLRTESSAPYSINGDNNGNFTAWNPGSGVITLVATPYTGGGGSGTAGISETVTFTVVNEAVSPPDCNGVPGGTATVDACGVCSGGNTGHVANADKDACGVCFGDGSSCAGACVTNEVVSFTLMHAGGGGEIGLLTNGMVINKAVVGSFSVRANKCNNNTSGSVKFIFNGSTIKTESAAPYSINGDNNGNFTAWNPAPGTHTLVATPYTGSGGSGTAGISETVVFTVVNEAVSLPDCNGVPGGTATVDACGVCSGGNTGHIANSDKDACGVCFGDGSSCSGQCQPLEVTQFMLVHEGTDGEIGLLTEGMTIYLGSIGDFSVRADVCTPSAVKSVKFNVNGGDKRTESSPPYSINGDSPAGNYTKWNPSPGNYILKVTPYTGTGGSGTAGIALTRNFTVVNGSAKMGPTISGNADADTDLVKIYPNPNSGEFMLECDVPQRQDVAIRIFNSLGQVVYEEVMLQFEGELKQPITLNSESGVYFVQLKLAGEVLHRKLVVRD